MTSQALIDAQQRLLDVRNAISRILRGAQTARYDGREVRYADLACVSLRSSTSRTSPPSPKRHKASPETESTI